MFIFGPYLMCGEYVVVNVLLPNGLFADDPGRIVGPHTLLTNRVRFLTFVMMVGGGGLKVPPIFICENN